MKYLNSKMHYGFKSKKYKIFPPMVILEITNVCNLKCIHCPHTFISKRNDYQPRHMKWDVYKKIIDEVALYEDIIFRFLSDGEPLMHPRFKDMIMLAKSKNIGPVNFVTNGHFLDKDMAHFILKYGVDVVEISIDALNKQTYTKIRREGDFDRVIANVERFIQLRNKMNAKTRIMVSIIDQKEAEAEVEDFIRYWKGRADRVIKREYTTIGGLVSAKKLKPKSNLERWPCPQLWKRMFINVDGCAEFCVEDWLDQTIVGDVNKQSIAEIWKDKHYQNLRMLHEKKKFDCIEKCAQCYDWSARTWDYDYFYAMEKVLEPHNL